jgi:hypothetical protein
MTVLLMIGTRKGLWIARGNDDRRGWDLGDPHFLMQEIPACASILAAARRGCSSARAASTGGRRFSTAMTSASRGTSPTVERSGSRPKWTLR